MSTRRSVADAYAWFAKLHEKLTPSRTRSPRPSSRRSTSASASSTMSGSTISTSTAPAARCRAARASASASRRQIGSGLSGVLYVLDEPSIGLHQKDNDRLLETLKRLKALGNTVLVVEHDEDAIRHADHVIDMGPGAGVHGGEVVCQGTLEELLACETSITADYLTGRREIPLPKTRRKGTRQVRHRPRRHRQQPPERHGRSSRSAPSPASPASAARASPRSPSTRSTPAPRAR